MALARCDPCGQPQGRRGNIYVLAVTPIRHPDGAVVCGKDRCCNPGKIWLGTAEHAAYQAGERIFGLPTAAVKVKVQ